ncbi:uncharacterized protein LOC141595660 [Silene latifolia]|uniref:uncharacterized protein LOC141595660 n=1 Tax=Silene latifolia TaxID=37657 RepID=UPI003D78178D
MEENNGVTKRLLPFIPNCISPLVPMILDSFKIIFLDYPKLFFVVYIVAALPTSILLTSLSISATPRHLKAYLMRLEWLSRVVPTEQGMKNVWETSQDELRKLYHFRVLHAVPILVFSLVTVVATVTITSLAYNRKNEVSLENKKKCPNLSAVFAALRSKWAWPLLAGVANSFVWIMWGHVLPILKIVGQPGAVVTMTVAEVVVEVYMMTVLSLSLVVSVEEERAGLDLIRAGLGVMKGRKVCGWVLSGLILVGTNCIGREMEMVMDGQDSEVNGRYTNWTVEMRVVFMVGLVIFLAWIILWSNVVFTVFYCDWRKRNVDRDTLEKDLDGDIEIL